jgi:hypothetical protein
MTTDHPLVSLLTACHAPTTPSSGSSAMCPMPEVFPPITPHPPQLKSVFAMSDMCFLPNRPQRKISLLGSTGSIGTQTLDIVEARPDIYEVTALAAGGNIDLLAKQIVQFRPKVASVQVRRQGHPHGHVRLF